MPQAAFYNTSKNARMNCEALSELSVQQLLAEQGPKHEIDAGNAAIC